MKYSKDSSGYAWPTNVRAWNMFWQESVLLTFRSMAPILGKQPAVLDKAVE